MNGLEPIVAIGLLTARDLERLGNTFDRAYQIPPDKSLDELMDVLHDVEWLPAQR